MSKRIHAILACVMGIAVLSVPSGAYAHDRGRHGGHPGHGWGHYQHHHHDHLRYRMIRERVVVYPLPPPPAIYAQRAYYGPPAIVIGVDMPPLLLRLR